MCEGGRPRSRPRVAICCFLAVVLVALCAILGRAGTGATSFRCADGEQAAVGSVGERINSNTIAVISGNLNATYVTIAYDLSAVLDDGDEFRVLPVIAKGGGQNIKDVRFLKGWVDLGITSRTCCPISSAPTRLGRSTTRSSTSPSCSMKSCHLIVRRSPASLARRSRRARKVNFSDIGSGHAALHRRHFREARHQAARSDMGQADAFEALKKGGIAATILIAGKPAGSCSSSRRRRLSPPSVAFDKPLQAEYLPANSPARTIRA